MDNLTKIKLKWMNDNFSLDKLRRFIHDDYPDSIFYKKDDVFVFEMDLKNKKFWIDYKNIWLFFESFFSMKYIEIQNFMSIWLEETSKLKEVTPGKLYGFSEIMLEETSKLKEVTPHIDTRHTFSMLEGTSKLKEV